MSKTSINMSWKEMIQVERGADITEMEAPIPSTIGEGFTFCLDPDGEKYTTTGDYTKGKRDVKFCITSYMGYCGGAEHYYCSISIPVVNRSGNKIAGGCLGGIKIPNEYQGFKASIVRPLSKEEAADTKRWEWYEEGDMVDAFCSLKELNKCIETIRKIFPEDKWNVMIERRI